MKYTLLALVVALSGCQTMEQQRQAAGPDPSAACFDTIGSRNPSLEILVPKVGSLGNTAGITMQALASNDKPTLQERQAIELWDTARGNCLQIGRPWREQHTPLGYRQALENGQMQVKQAFGQLYAGNITYGQFAQMRQQITTSTAGQMGAVAQQEANAEQQRRALATQYLLQQQQIQQQNRPVLTTCDRFGTTTNCTSR